MQKIDLHDFVPADAVMVVLHCSTSKPLRLYRSPIDSRPLEVTGGEARLVIELEEAQTLYLETSGTHAIEVMGYGRA